MMLACPKCGGTPVTTVTRYGDRHDCCGLWSWQGKPLVDAETHEARKKAHEAFDPLWKSKLMSRSKAYKLLREDMGLSREDCHISFFDKVQCEKAIDVSRAALGEKE